jgi:glycine betaine/choline ABC-type transport system substrate-binding protein
VIQRWWPTLALAVGAGCGTGDRIVVASKNFTESVILGELVAQHLEHAGFDVDRRLNLGGTFICHEALLAGSADLYVEYTGTAYAAILELPTERDPARVRQVLDSVYAARWNLEWLDPLGFENTFAILIRGADARRMGLETLSDAIPYAASWRAGFGYEFMERADGYRGLREAYGLAFRDRPAVMDLGLTYRALAEGRVDVIAGNSTDGQIEALGLFQLRDDRRYFPPYEAVPVARRAVLDAHPTLRGTLRVLSGRLDERAIRRLNYLVDVERRDLREVVREFLAAGSAPAAAVP